MLARRELLHSYYRAFLDLRDLELPVVAAVNGPAVGAGLNLALCADIRVAGRSARFGATFVGLGIHAGGGATALLTRLVGPGHAAELLLGGEIIDAERALSIGLVERLVEDEDLASTATAMATSIAAGAPAVVRMTKRTLRLAQDAEFASVLELECRRTAFGATTKPRPIVPDGIGGKGGEPLYSGPWPMGPRRSCSPPGGARECAASVPRCFRHSAAVHF